MPNVGWTCRECKFWNASIATNYNDVFCAECRRLRYEEPIGPFKLSQEERELMLAEAEVRTIELAQELAKLRNPIAPYRPDEAYLYPDRGIDAYETWGD